MRGYDKIAQGYTEIEASTTLSSDFERDFVLQRDKPGFRESEDALCSGYSGYYIAYRGLNGSTLQYRSDACSTAYLTASYPYLLNLTRAFVLQAFPCDSFMTGRFFSQCNSRFLRVAQTLSGLFSHGMLVAFTVPLCPNSFLTQELAMSMFAAHVKSVLFHAFLLSGLVSSFPCLFSYRLSAGLLGCSEFMQDPPYNKPCSSFPQTSLVGCYCLNRFETLVDSVVRAVFGFLSPFFLCVGKGFCVAVSTAGHHLRPEHLFDGG